MKLNIFSRRENGNHNDDHNNAQVIKKINLNVYFTTFITLLTSDKKNHFCTDKIEILSFIIILSLIQHF